MLVHSYEIVQISGVIVIGTKYKLTPIEKLSVRVLRQSS